MVTLKDDMEKSASGNESSENVKVVVRVRPLNDSEKSSDFRSIVHVDSINGTVKLENVSSSRENPPKVFTFDTVFPPDVKQVLFHNSIITNKYNIKLEVLIYFNLILRIFQKK